MRKIALFSAIVLSVLIVSCSKSVEDAEKVISVDGLAKHISTLASDDFEGRKPFTDGEDKALEYIEKSMKELGLKPVFENGSYRQAVPLVEIMGYPSKKMEIKLSKRKSMEFNLLDDFVVQSQTTSEEISVKDLPMVFAGYGIVAPEYGWIDSTKTRAKKLKVPFNLTPQYIRSIMTDICPRKNLAAHPPDAVVPALRTCLI